MWARVLVAKKSQKIVTSSIGMSLSRLFRNFSSFGRVPPDESPFSSLMPIPSLALAPGCIALAPFGFGFLGFLYTNRSRKWESVFKDRSGLDVMG